MGLEDLDIRDQLHYWKHEAEANRVVLEAERALYGQSYPEFLVGVECPGCGGIKTLYSGESFETALAVKQHYENAVLMHHGRPLKGVIHIFRRAALPWQEVGDDGIIL